MSYRPQAALILTFLLATVAAVHAQTSPLTNFSPLTVGATATATPAAEPTPEEPAAEPTTEPTPEEPAAEPTTEPTPEEPAAEPTPTPFTPQSLPPTVWATATPTRVVEREPSDDYKQALPIALPCVVSSTFSEAKASAWYTFEVPPGGAPSLYVAMKPGEPPTRGFSLYLHDQAGTLTSSDWFPMGQGEYLTSLSLPAGIYFLSVEAGGTETVPFELLVAGVPEVTPEQVGAALNKALDWLVAHQNPDGGFQSERGGPGIAGLATQALMNFEGPHRNDWKAIYKGLDYVASCYHDPAALDADSRIRLGGSICKDEGHAMYEHGIGLTTLLEAYLLGVDDTLKPTLQKAIDYTLVAQLSTERPAELNSPVTTDSVHLGGWRYEATATNADLSVTGWQVISLFTAQKAGFKVPQARMDMAREYARRCYHPTARQFAYMAETGDTSPGRSAMGALSLQILGVGTDDPMVKDGLRHMLTQAPTWEGEPGSFPFYYWFYGTRAAYLAGGDTWKVFKSCIQSLLVHHQDPAGTWQRNCKEADEADDVYVTALGALMLEICAGHLPPYLRQGTVAKRVLPPKAPPLEVDLTCVVTDQANNYLMDLTQQDFAVAEDGTPQTVVRFGAELKPVSMALVLDDSGSLKRSVEEVKSAAARFVSLLKPSDRATVVVFADDVKVVQDFTADRAALTGAVKTLRAKGGTALYDAVCLACERLKPIGGRTAVIVLTDGKDEDDPGTGPGSKHTLDQAIRAAKEAGVTVFALGLGTKMAKQVLEDLAKETGGRAYFPPTAKDLAEVYDLIVKELRSQYTVGYTSKKPTRDGKWRAVEVTVPGKPYTVRTRKGFFAK